MKHFYDCLVKIPDSYYKIAALYEYIYKVAPNRDIADEYIQRAKEESISSGIEYETALRRQLDKMMGGGKHEYIDN